ncbi:hypothetical protein VNO78_05210 [Psophocarpus tetragonolobus]|uniref:Secreted protein n=1 Tax=Psophocarpus tetragonolobus TaxID=3891 RepID=A0AAN9SQK6_PSOTE
MLMLGRLIIIFRVGASHLCPPPSNSYLPATPCTPLVTAVEFPRSPHRLQPPLFLHMLPTPPPADVHSAHNIPE